MVQIFNRILWIPIEWLEFAFECFESRSKGLNLHSNGSNGYNLHSIASNLFRVVQTHIWMHRIPFEWFKLRFERFECLLSGSNLDSNGSNPFRMSRICIWLLRIWFEGFKFAFEWLELVHTVRICIRTLRILFEGYKFAFECVESCPKGTNLDSNALSLVWMFRISTRMLRIPFEWF